ncbi:hypothetical protein KAU09_00865 [Candidatus Parcubacteria bacterium]|nr:hypothetical protein [Candidatus Parcubacteria bacterium]
MKKYIFIVGFFGFFLLAPFLAYADTMESALNSQMNVGNFSYEEGADFPHSQPGPSGGFVTMFHPIGDGKDKFYVYTTNSLDNLSLDEMLRISKDVKNKLTDKIINYRIPANNKPVKLLRKIPVNMHSLGKFAVRGKLDQDLDSLCAMVEAEGKINTFCKFGLFLVQFKNRPTATGISTGSGAAKDIGNEAAASVGALLGRSWAENYTINLVQFIPFGGVKIPVEQKPIAVKQIVKKEFKSICEPIYFGFDEDMPLPRQDEKFRKIAFWLKDNSNNITELEIRGRCDKEPNKDYSENYNSPLGFCRGKNVMYIIISYTASLFDSEKEKKAFVEAAALKFRATSASNHNPDFKAGNNLCEEQADQFNRRVELILNGQNLTPIL